MDSDPDNSAPSRPIGWSFSSPHRDAGLSGFSVAIVGGGVAGFSTVNALIDVYSSVKGRGGQFSGENLSATQGPVKVPVLSIHWFDEANNFGPGQVYQPYDNTVDLNEYAGKMSVFPNDPDHCINWLNIHHPGLLENSEGYISRAIYGEYLRDCTRILFEKATHAGVALTAVAESKVNDVDKINGGLQVRLAGGGKIPVSKAVIAVGHKRASIEEDPLKLGDDQPRYCFRITGENLGSVMEDMAKIRSGTILIPGSGAAMVDYVRRVIGEGFRGNFVIVTRNDIFPWPNRANDNTNPYILTWDREKIRALATEYEISNGQQTSEKRTRVQVMDDFVTLVNDEIKKALDAKYNPRTFLDSEALTEILDSEALREDSSSFVAEANRIIARFKGNPTPPKDARLIHRLREEGRFRVIIGSPDKVRANEKQITVGVKKRDGSIETVKCDYAFNGAPHARDYRASGFMQNIVRSCGGRFNPDGVIEVNPLSHEIPGVKGYSFIGAFAKPTGSDRDTWGVQTLIRQAQTIATKIMFDFSQEALLAPRSVGLADFRQNLSRPASVMAPLQGVG